MILTDVREELVERLTSLFTKGQYILVVLLDKLVSLYMFVNVLNVALVMSSRMLVVMDNFFLERVMDEITWKFMNWAKLWAWYIKIIELCKFVVLAGLMDGMDCF